MSEQFRGLAVGVADMKAKPVRSQEATGQRSSQVLNGGNEKRPLICNAYKVHGSLMKV